MEQIDITAELLELDDTQYYSDWEQQDTSVTEDGTTITILIDGFSDAEYLDVTPVFDLVTQEIPSVSNPFWIESIRFCPEDVRAKVQISSAVELSSLTLSESVIVNERANQWFELEEDVLTKIDYDNRPLIVGYCGEDFRLAIEV